jgi:hypothetical protein
MAIVLTAGLVAATAAAGSRVGAPIWRVVASKKGDTYNAIDVHAANDVWAWGERSSDPAKILLGHWDGARWGTVTLSDLPPEV